MLKQNFGWAWSMWAGRPRVGYGAMYKVNRCRNEEVILKGNFGKVWRWIMWTWMNDLCLKKKIGWSWSMWTGRPRVCNGAMHKVNWLKGNFGWVYSMWAGRPRVGNGAMYVQYQLEVNRCRNDEIIVKGNFGWVWSMWTGRPRLGNGAMHKVQYQFEFRGSSAYRIVARTDSLQISQYPNAFQKAWG
ncbi:hypothetical protein DPMN_083699 [Dreissena polymorpha]|uniref:Uncharacterized protein n=1 Tax=Dreissena polymorpha TaxID=45954 RepID=A0A9D4BIQ2_DREPO|nr:hypothetical protein DPMN_083699 [Dreissena polymorpha]